MLRKAAQRLRIPQHDGRHQSAGRPVQSLCIPVGRLVAISPYQLHHDPRFFRKPELFDPSRHTPAAHGAFAHHSGPAPPADRLETGRAGVERATEATCASEAAGRMVGANRTRVAFGVGPFRCPGRAFAMAEAALAVGTFFSCFDATLSPSPRPKDPSVARRLKECGHAKACAAHTDCMPSETACQATDCASSADAGADADATCDPRVQGGDASHGRPLRQHAEVPPWLSEQVVPGAHVVARGVLSGDSSGLLPTFEPRLLVGVKKPVGALWATCQQSAD